MMQMLREITLTHSVQLLELKDRDARLLRWRHGNLMAGMRVEIGVPVLMICDNREQRVYPCKIDSRTCYVRASDIEKGADEPAHPGER